MPKEVIAVVKLNLPAGEANPAPPVGPALGQHGVAIMDFCKAYNEQTANQKGTIVPAVITIYADRTFDFITKTSPASTLLAQAAGIKQGSATPNREKVGSVTRKQVEDIAKKKMQDLNAKNLEAAIKIITGTARSMGIEITN